MSTSAYSWDSVTLSTSRTATPKRMMSRSINMRLRKGGSGRQQCKHPRLAKSLYLLEEGLEGSSLKAKDPRTLLTWARMVLLGHPGDHQPPEVLWILSNQPQPLFRSGPPRRVHLRLELNDL